MSEELFERYLRDDLDEAGARELSAILATEEGARAFSEFVQEWTLLGEAARQRVADAERQGSRRIRKRTPAATFRRSEIGWAAGLAVAVLFMIALATPARLPAPPPIAKFEPPPPVPVEPALAVAEIPPAPAPRPDPVPDPAPTPVPPLPPPPQPAPKADLPAPPLVVPKAVEPPQPETPRITKPEEAPRPAIALLRRAAGEVFVVSPGGRRRAVANEGLAPDEGLEVAGPHGQATLEFPDTTRIDVHPESTLERLADKQGKRGFTLARGSISATVFKQPVGRSLAVATPHAEITVLGTQFVLAVSAEFTRLEVREGRVRITRADGASVEVPAHHSATAMKGQKLESKPTFYTLELQDGLAGYAGTRDSSISGADPGKSFGAAEVLEVDGDEVDGKKIHGLLKWDLAGVPRGAVIRSAVITLDIVNESQGKGYSFFEMKRAWSEPEFTWSQSAGLKDRGTEALGTVAPRTKGTLTILLNASGEGVIQGWLRKPDANHGFVIANDMNSDGFKFHSREANPSGLRPKLTLTYTLAK